MKRPTIYIVLFLYLTALVKPIFPVVNDFIAHAFWKMEHLATVHYENGKYHIHAELANASNESYPSKRSGALNSSESLAFHLITSESMPFTKNSENYAYALLIVSNLFSAFLGKDAPPPKSL